MKLLRISILKQNILDSKKYNLFKINTNENLIQTGTRIRRSLIRGTIRIQHIN